MATWREKMEPSGLPIDAVLPQVLEQLATSPRLVLHAPPGAGKTTRVPLALLESGRRGRIVMLEPRRLAARAAASWMARLTHTDVGDIIGYRVRMDSRVSTRTRLEVVTEGVLTRMLLDDPSLDGIDVVIFDEFHERSIHADLGLALALQSQALLRPELRIVVMSATLDVEAVAALLDDPPVVTSEGRVHPVDTIYTRTRVTGPIEAAAAGAVQRALDAHAGDVLVFLPGAAEIRRTAERLGGMSLPPHTQVHMLFGDLPQQEQERAIAPAPPGTRKVVLATSIAETSLTIEGVRIVIDSGLMRVPRFSPRSGMTQLLTVPVSRAAADQRRGRAGRTAPGVCYRLWTEGEHAALLAHRPPEILEADLAPLALELAAWGVMHPSELRWIDSPPDAAYAQARELLRELDALDAEGRITQHGRALASIALHPRLAHMLLRARSLALAPLGCDIAALLSERDIIRADDGVSDPDLRLRLPLLHGNRQAPPGHRIDHGALQRARAEAAQWRRRLHIPANARADDEHTGLLLAFAYPDRIAQQRGARGRFVMRNGRGAAMDARHNLAADEFLVVADVGGHGTDSRIYLAAPIARVDIETHFAAQIERSTEIEFDTRNRARGVARRTLGTLLLDEREVADVPADDIRRTLLERVRRDGLDALTWTDDARLLRERLAFLHLLDGSDWPDVSDDALLASLETWLEPWIDAAQGDLRRVPISDALLAHTDWRNERIAALAPTHLDVPSGSRVPIDYSDPAAPVLAVRLQEMFGLADTPRIGGGRVPLTLHLLSPARRPVQVTRDLASFWASAYFDVRKDLRGRYPKHYWPDDPLQAEPTHRTRPRR